MFGTNGAVKEGIVFRIFRVSRRRIVRGSWPEGKQRPGGSNSRTLNPGNITMGRTIC